MYILSKKTNNVNFSKFKNFSEEYIQSWTQNDYRKFIVLRCGKQEFENNSDKKRINKIN